jgi:hypothetical protein
MQQQTMASRKAKKVASEALQDQQLVTAGLDKRLFSSSRSDQKWTPTSEIPDSKDLSGKTWLGSLLPRELI